MINENDLVEGSIWKLKDFDTKYKLTKRYSGSQWVSMTRIEPSTVLKGYEMILAGLGKTASGIAFPVLDKINAALDELTFSWQYMEMETINIPFSCFYNGDFVQIP